VCTYQTEQLSVNGSAKGPGGWFSLSSATVYFDHPAHYPAEHSLNIDFLNLGGGALSRVAVELDPASARELARAILDTLQAVPRY
jgi:diaminopimelate decarboxylase